MKTKRLTLIRHAKSSWEFDVIDHERPLKTRGKNDADLIAKALGKINLKPDAIKISDAKRTLETSHIILPYLNVDQTIITYNHKLYDFSGELLLDVIKNTSPLVNHLLVFGHNYAITNFVNSYGTKIIDNVPTCGVVMLEFATNDWSNLGNGSTLDTIFPRDLK
jgi:phosphohistidine phosphatase